MAAPLKPLLRASRLPVDSRVLTRRFMAAAMLRGGVERKGLLATAHWEQPLSIMPVLTHAVWRDCTSEPNDLIEAQ